MKALAFSILIGLAAGTLNALPMILQKMNKKAILSAFLQYFFAGIIITNIDLPLIPWYLEGGITAFMMALPVVIIVSTEDKKAVPIILTMSVIPGTLISLAGHYFI
ncbi:MAG: hypothetical protein JW982_09245 [Spirochaetes bacterium]|nr:hypothetical protein [Spirochaetota bacterium]